MDIWIQFCYRKTENHMEAEIVSVLMAVTDLENALAIRDVEYPRCLDNPEQRVFDDMLRCRPKKQIYHRQYHGKDEHMRK
ncbi:hypothetical protein TNCV_4855301 [Trichonephila clavipes]|nr:hypothetical protein TNCV_4855301 [Trichonephila clavipes]